MLTISETPASNKDATALLRELEAEMALDYPPEHRHGVKAGEEASFNGIFWVAHQDDALLGCVGLKLRESAIGEIKGMYVRPEGRGQGIAQALLETVESKARGMNLVTLCLETGNRQQAAQGLYETMGYERVECFAEYARGPFSVCYEKYLNEDSQ